MVTRISGGLGGLTAAERKSTRLSRPSAVTGPRPCSECPAPAPPRGLNDAAASGEEISVSGIARRAGVDRTFLYRHHDLLEQLHAAEAQPPGGPATGYTVSRASLQADLLAAQERAARLAARVRQLERRLSERRTPAIWRRPALRI